VDAGRTQKHPALLASSREVEGNKQGLRLHGDDERLVARLVFSPNPYLVIPAKAGIQLMVVQ
jgi:hypothetical protein